MRGSVWHLDCCNPENNFDSDGWTIFGAIFGWTNSATLGAVLSYVFYWIAVVVTLVTMKFRDDRVGQTNRCGRATACCIARAAAGAWALALSRTSGAARGRSQAGVGCGVRGRAAGQPVRGLGREK